MRAQPSRFLSPDIWPGPAGAPKRGRMRRGRGPDRHDAPIYTSAIAVLALLVSSLVTLSSCSAANPAASPSWRVVTSPNFGSGGSELHAIAAVSANDVWAVGGYRPTIPDQDPNLPFPPDQSQALVEHWNGKVWNYTSSLTFAPPEYSYSDLSAVAALATNDVWAVGSLTKSNIGHPQTLIEHWDGTNWQHVSSPNVGTGGSALTGLAAISANNIWAVGNGHAPFFVHWDGTSWKLKPSPTLASSSSELHAVAALSTSDVWAVGEVVSSVGHETALIEHWDGTSWNVTAGPSPESSHFSALSAVAAISADNIWAVGETITDPNDVSQTLIEHWNGTSWKVVFSPNKGGGGLLTGVAAVSATSIWAVGTSWVDSSAGPTSKQTLAEQWDGLSSPAPPYLAPTRDPSTTTSTGSQRPLQATSGRRVRPETTTRLSLASTRPWIRPSYCSTDELLDTLCAEGRREGNDDRPLRAAYLASSRHAYTGHAYTGHAYAGHAYAGHDGEPTSSSLQA
jgi:hypothetical protein